MHLSKIGLGPSQPGRITHYNALSPLGGKLSGDPSQSDLISRTPTRNIFGIHSERIPARPDRGTMIEETPVRDRGLDWPL